MTDDQRPARGYSWPPFEEGHRRSLVHGANSDRTIAPVAARIEADARAAPSWPDYLDDPSYGHAVTAWCWAEAVCTLLREYLAGQDIAAMLTEQSSEDTDEQRTKGRTRRRTTTQRAFSALEMLRKWESIAAGRRKDIGLDPLSRAKLGKDIAIGTAVTARLDELQRTGAVLVEAARTSGALGATLTPEVEQSAQPHQPAADGALAAQSGGSDAEQD